ncbi:baseplate assembly protein [Pseudoalteromonas aurantia]|uniref:Baseplate J-like C-terminal domain-containing protein n=1 Tax=Pseudoalteromonas aurantia 208 TaxID=1314867 RepID=A0ABR9E9H5_9GAMM|nr:baseplate J/gp47 family protein [Pseudoalteromonas aurantia]MBE0367626.1 hypothetical protein [Pseudoalteromonas aurantia 208]
MSLTNFSAIELNQLPTPSLVESLSFDAISSAILADYKTRFPDAQLNFASDPVIKLIECFAYRELLVRARINEGAEAVLLAKATRTELDYLGQRFGVKRAVRAGVDQVNNVNSVASDDSSAFESDERFRTRIKLALEGFSTAGPVGAYAFHSYKASSHIKDVFIEAPEFVMQAPPSAMAEQLPSGTMLLKNTYSADLTTPMPGDVAITLLSDEGNGTPSNAVLQAVEQHLNQDDIRPLTDRVNLLEPHIFDFEVKAKLHLYPGLNADEICAESQAACQTWLNTHHKLGHDISLSGLYAVLHSAGVQRVELISPTADIVVAQNQAAYCTQLTVSVEAQRNV